MIYEKRIKTTSIYSNHQTVYVQRKKHEKPPETMIVNYNVNCFVKRSFNVFMVKIIMDIVY